MSIFSEAIGCFPQSLCWPFHSSLISASWIASISPCTLTSAWIISLFLSLSLYLFPSMLPDVPFPPLINSLWSNFSISWPLSLQFPLTWVSIQVFWPGLWGRLLSLLPFCSLLSPWKNRTIVAHWESLLWSVSFWTYFIFLPRLSLTLIWTFRAAIFYSFSFLAQHWAHLYWVSSSSPSFHDIWSFPSISLFIRLHPCPFSRVVRGSWDWSPSLAWKSIGPSLLFLSLSFSLAFPSLHWPSLFNWTPIRIVDWTF